MIAHRQLRGLIRRLSLPRKEILFLHVRLKGLAASRDYHLLTRHLLTALMECAQPTTLLIPTFTYSFTSTGYYDRVRSPCEVGRFGEETRTFFAASLRTMNPVFNCIDTQGYFSLGFLDETSAFGTESLLAQLARRGYVIVNLNLPRLVSTHLHFLEFQEEVPYRFEKHFQGLISDDGRQFRPLSYRYYVRDLRLDTRWRRKKIAAYLQHLDALREIEFEGLLGRWIFSTDLDRHIGAALKSDPNFLITD